MTLDDLLEVFDKGFAAKLALEDYPREAFGTPTLNRAGIRAVVLALRDHIEDGIKHYAWNSEDAHKAFNDILGSDAVEKEPPHD